MSLRKTKKNASPIKSISHDSPPFVFDPPLPTLWSSYDVSKEQLVGTLQGDAAQRLYDTVLSKFDIDDPQMTVPRRSYGKGNATTVPILSLGGFVALGSSVMRNRKLTFPCGCGCKGQLFLACNGLLLPLLLFIIVWVTALGTSIFSLEVEVFGWLLPWWMVACVSSLAMPCCWFIVAAWMVGCEHQTHLDGLFDFAHNQGIDHVETARHYLESEAQLKPVLRRQREKGQQWMVQTKVRPYVQKDAFYKTSVACMETLGVQQLDLLTIHGVNIPSHVDITLANSMDEACRLREEGKAKMIGFAAHCHTNDIIRLINTEKFDFVNLHFGFFSSYTNLNNQPAVLAASQSNMGVYCISPSNQGGELHKPSTELIELCFPFHPLEFGLLYLMTHRGVGDTGTVSCGPTNSKELDRQLRAIQLIPHAAKLLPPVVARLRAAARSKLGSDWCDGLTERVSVFTQGNNAMPGALSLSLLLGCHGLWKAFNSKSYLVRMADNLSWPGDWCAGGSLGVLRGKTNESAEMKQFREALDTGRKEKIETDTLLAALREIEDLIPPPNEKRCGKRILGKVMQYGTWWVGAASRLSGYKPTKEYGEMPKTKN